MTKNADGEETATPGRSPDGLRLPRRSSRTSPDSGGATIHPFPARPDLPDPSVPAADASPVCPQQMMFGPDSITWSLHRDPLMGIAGLRGLFLHALHPVAMGALADHKVDWDPWQRLARTAHYIGISTFGTTADAMIAGSRLRSVHAQVSGMTRQGRPYTAESPDLLLWVHNCLVASFLEIVTRGGYELSPRQQDQYLTEQVRAATLVGLEPDQVPHDRAQLQEYFRRMRGALAVTPAARTAVTRALAPEPPSTRSGYRPSWTPMAGLAFSALPKWARRLYMMPELTEAASLDHEEATLRLRELRIRLDGRLWACPPRHRVAGSRRHGPGDDERQAHHPSPPSSGPSAG
jgi:uncharacterized protein (DUF2236 family)